MIVREQNAVHDIDERLTIVDSRKDWESRTLRNRRKGGGKGERRATQSDEHLPSQVRAASYALLVGVKVCAVRAPEV